MIQQRLSVLCLILVILTRSTNANSTQLATQNSIKDHPESTPELILQTGHIQGITSLAFSPDGKLLASASNDNTVKIWDVDTGRELRTYARHNDLILSVAWSLDGRVASGSYDKKIHIWDPETGNTLRVLEGHKKSVTALAFSPNNNLLASGSDDCNIIIWNNLSGEKLSTLAGHSKAVLSVAFSSDGKLIASSSEDHSVKLWNVSDQRELRSLESHNDDVNIVTFSRDSRFVISSSSDNTIKVWGTATGQLLRTLNGHKKGVNGHVVSLDGRTLISCSEDLTIKLWDLQSGREIRQIGSHGVAVNALALTPQGHLLASADNAGRIKVWNTDTWREEQRLTRYTGPVTSVTFSPDGRWMASGSYDYWVRLWDTAGDELRKFRGHGKAVDYLAFTPDSQLLVSSDSGGLIIVWEVATGRERYVLQEPPHADVRMSGDGKVLVSVSRDQDKMRTVKVWDVNEGSKRAEWKIDQVLISFALNRDGSRILSHKTSEAFLIDTMTGKELKTFSSDEVFVEQVYSFSPDDKYAVCGGETDDEGVVIFWDVESGKQLFTLKTGMGELTTLAFNTDGKQLIIGSEDHTAQIWDVENRGRLVTLKGHLNSIQGVCFNPKGNLVASASRDGSLRLWDSKRGKLRATLVCPTQGESWVAVQPEGFFDGSLADLNRIFWRFNGKIRDIRSLESYFNDFYHPGLLAEVLKGDELKPPRELALLDRRLPKAMLTLEDTTLDPNKPIRERLVNLRVQVVGAPAEGGATLGGVRDVRLFRNGTLVAKWSGIQTLTDGRASLKAKVKLMAGENRLTAYAFNQDNIKSEETLPLVLRGDDSLKRKGTLYILTVGINEYANRAFNLRFARSDAEEFAQSLAQQQNKLNNYGEVKIVPLIDADATKKNLLSALRILATGSPGSISEKTSSQTRTLLANLKQAEPEDAIVIYFAGHGKATQDGHFYLIPNDVKRADEVAELDMESTKRGGISDQELEESLARVDAEQLVLIVDACHAGKFLETGDVRRGPMNSKGLGQLAYEKGMYVLAAAQGFQAALEDPGLKHGVLTYVLVQKGLKEAEADSDPRDGQVLLKEWFDYTSRKVPEIQINNIKHCRDVSPACTLAYSDDKEDGLNKLIVQRPRAYYRRESDARSFLVAELATATRHFDQDGIVFDYPGGWEVNRRQGSNQIDYYLSNPVDETSIHIFFVPVVVPPERIDVVKKTFDDLFVGDEVKQITSRSGWHVSREPLQVQIAGVQAEGVRLRTFYDDQPRAIHDMCWSLVKGRPVFLKLYTTGSSGRGAASAWDLIRRTIQVN
jgi:WD40 repeat protein